MPCQTYPNPTPIAGFAVAKRGVFSEPSLAGWLRHPLRSAWQAALAWQQRSFDRHALLELNDDQLRDIGLTRKDVQHAARDWRRAGPEA